MEVLEYFFNLKLKNTLFYPRRLKLPKNSSFFLYGARGVGKSYLIIDYLNNLEKKYLYIDAQDPIFVFEELLKSEIEKFIYEEEIETLVIDHFFEGFLEGNINVKQLIFISREDICSLKFPKFKLLPLDYEEFLGFEKVLNTKSTFNHFLKLGTLPKVAKGETLEHFINVKEFFLEKFDEMESRLLLIIAKFHARRASPHQIYTLAKEYFKISKDWTYKTIKKMKQEGVIYYLDETYQKGARVILIYDFVLAKYLNKNLTFTQTFESIIALALIKKSQKFATLGRMGFLLFEKKILIYPGAFVTKEQILKRVQKEFEIFKKFGIRSVIVTTISNNYTFEFRGISFEALPLYEWILGD